MRARAVALLLVAIAAPLALARGPKGAPQPSGPPAFADVVRDGEALPGLFAIHRRDGKAWMELKPEQLDVVFLCSPTLDVGLGERRIYGGRQLPVLPIAFHRAGDTVQLVHENLRFSASDDASTNAAIARSFSASVLATTPVASAPKPDGGAFLVELAPLFLSDLANLGSELEATYKAAYEPRTAGSELVSLKAFPDNVQIGARLNFAVERLPVSDETPGAEGVVLPPLASPDARSLLLTVRYDIAARHETGYVPRLADDRIGYFETLRKDLSDPRRETPYVRYVNRWQLEKADLSAPLSPPKDPIVFWLDASIPEAYRPALRAGVLAWNRAFERIGLSGALEVRDRAEDAEWDTADARYNTIRWFEGQGADYFVGHIHADPLTGRIYDADISMGGGVMRDLFGFAADVFAPLQRGAAPRTGCGNAAGAAARAAAALQASALAGHELTEDELQRFVHEFLVEVTSHEVGHALGLRHNFSGSLWLPLDEVHRRARETTLPWAASVMDYLPYVLGPGGRIEGRCYGSGIGPYDELAIAYGYSLTGATRARDELAALDRIAARTAEPGLRYATDEDVGYGAGQPFGIDPDAARWDLGSEPLAHCEKELSQARTLWSRLATQDLEDGASFERVRRGFDMSFWWVSDAFTNAMREVGGMRNPRGRAGSSPGMVPFTPLPALRQRAALLFVARNAFGPGAFRVEPGLLNRLALPRFPAWDAPGLDNHVQRLDYAFHDRVLGVQRMVLDSLLSPVRLARLQDLELRFDDPARAFTMAQLFEDLQGTLWSEILAPSAPNDIDSLRRAAQREHLARLAAMVVRPDASLPADATALARHELTNLRRALTRQLGSGELLSANVATRAHLESCLATIHGALEAKPEAVR